MISSIIAGLNDETIRVIMLFPNCNPKIYFSLSSNVFTKGLVSSLVNRIIRNVKNMLNKMEPNNANVYSDIIEKLYVLSEE